VKIRNLVQKLKIRIQISNSDPDLGVICSTDPCGPETKTLNTTYISKIFFHVVDCLDV
jgi:hypothetical protein